MSIEDDASSTHEQIEHLCLEAGRIMEDLSSELATPLPRRPGAAAERVENLVKGAAQILAHATAAQALVERASMHDAPGGRPA